jgi:acyl carrier protein
MTPDYPEILARLSAHLRNVAGPDAAITEDADLIEQIGLDSGKVLDLLMEIEDEFDVSVPMNALADVRTVRNLAETIHDLLGKDHGATA